MSPLYILDFTLVFVIVATVTVLLFLYTKVEEKNIISIFTVNITNSFSPNLKSIPKIQEYTNTQTVRQTDRQTYAGVLVYKSSYVCQCVYKETIYTSIQSRALHKILPLWIRLEPMVRGARYTYAEYELIHIRQKVHCLSQCLCTSAPYILNLYNKR